MVRRSRKIMYRVELNFVDLFFFLTHLERTQILHTACQFNVTPCRYRDISYFRDELRISCSGNWRQKKTNCDSDDVTARAFKNLLKTKRSGRKEEWTYTHTRARIHVKKERKKGEKHSLKMSVYVNIWRMNRDYVFTFLSKNLHEILSKLCIFTNILVKNSTKIS